MATDITKRYVHRFCKHRASLLNQAAGISRASLERIRRKKIFYSRKFSLTAALTADFEIKLNEVLVETFNSILKYEELSLNKIMSVPITVGEAHMIEAISLLKNNVTISGIASKLHIAPPTATVAVKKLENKGFIKKEPCETDGRSTVISLTESGERIERAHRVFHKKMVKNISSQILNGEKDILLIAIKRLNEYFKSRIEV